MVSSGGRLRKETPILMRILRVKQAMTQKELGEAVGITFHAIAHYEARRRTPTPEHLCKIAEVLGYPYPNDLLGDGVLCG